MRIRLTIALGLLGFTLAALLLPASALGAHQWETSFGPDGSETTHFTPGNGSRPVAVDTANGNIYVANRADQAIFKFNENHQPSNFSALGANKITGVLERSAEGRGQLAVDSTSHRIYATAGASQNSILAFEASGLPAEFSALGADEITGFSGLCGVAVDTGGDIYAADRVAGKVVIFAPSGVKLTEFAVGEVGGKPESGPCNLAVDSTGAVYVNHWGSSVEKFTPSSFPVTSLTTYSSAGMVDASSEDRSLAVNSANNHLYVLRAVGSFGGTSALTEVIEFDSTGSEVPPPFGDSEPGKLHLSAGIAVKGSGGSERIYASDLIGKEGVSIFGASVTPPEVGTGPAGEVTKTTATITGTINPQSVEVTKCTFEYGTGTGYGESVPCDTVDGNPISDPSEIPIDSNVHTVTAHLANLAPNTEYHFRISAKNSSISSPVTGEDEIFETFGPPLITEEGVAEVTATSARINGEIDPRGEATTYAVQFVSSAQFEASKWAEAATVAGPVSLPAQVTGTGDLSAAAGSADLSAAKGEGMTSEGSSKITSLSTSSGEFAVGQQISGPGIPSGTKIVARSATTLTISTAATTTSVSPVTLTAASATLTDVHIESGQFAIGQRISGKEIPNGATITAIEGTTLTISAPVGASATAVAITAGSARVTELATTAGAFRVGQRIFGLGIPTGTTIASVGEGELVLSEIATTAGEGVALTASGPQQIPPLSLSGLTPGTVYHFRLVAENEAGETTVGEEGLGEEGHTFATFPPAPSTLPDGRAYELVSPPAKAGEVFPPETEGKLGGSCADCLPSAQAKMPMQPTPDGGAIAYEGQAFGAGMAAEANEYLASRDPLSGWATVPLSHPEYRADHTSAEQNQGFLAFSDVLSRAVISQVEPPLAPGAPPNYSNLYLWAGPQAPLTPLITQVPPNRPAGNTPSSFIAIYAGANAGPAAPFTHIAFEANDSLTLSEPGIAPEAPAPVDATEHDVYEWSGGRLHLVNVLPGNAEASPNAVIGSGRLLSRPQGEGPDFSHAISDDGSEVFWSDKATGHVYVRLGGEETGEIHDPGRFLTAAADGSRVLLSDGCLYSLETEECDDLTRDEGGAGTHKGGFQGILGASEDLSRVYFIDTEKLTEEENGEGAKAQLTQPNLYLWEGGRTSFIATLLPKDDSFGGTEETGDWRPSPSQRTAQVSEDGRYLAFMSIAGLTGYDNSQREGKGCFQGIGSLACAEVYEYDAATAKLTCASCNPSGQRPLGYSNLTLIGANGGGISTFYEQPRNLTAGGRLFFESQDALVTKDSNGHIQDVYEWEPNGTGSCVSTQDEGGCLGLISSGTSPYDSQFLNATPSGDDAFIVTRQRLLPQDKDDYLDLYDARVGAGIPEAVEVPCAGEGCRGPLGAVPAEVVSGSTSFTGPGNQPPPCRAGYVRKQGKCVKKKSKKPKHDHKKKRSQAKNRKGGAR